MTKSNTRFYGGQGSMGRMKSTTETRERNRIILALHIDGMRSSEIAEHYNLSYNRVRQIIKRDNTRREIVRDGYYWVLKERSFKIDRGGLNRCCIKSIDDVMEISHRRPVRNNKIIKCTWCDDPYGMIYSNGCWKWNK